jgi:hypothetical protein
MPEQLESPVRPAPGAPGGTAGLAPADWWFAAAGAGLWVLAMAAWRPTPFEGLDFLRIVEPYLRFFRTSVLSGEMPWWNPYASLGRPYAADLQTASFYPATYLTVALGVPAGWIAATALHGMLALLGFVRLVREWSVPRPVAWGGAMVFLFSAPLLARMQEGQVNYVYSICYLPLVLALAGRYALDPTRRRWVGLAVVWGLQLLCCHPQVFWLSAFGAGVYVTGLLLQPPWPAALRAWLRAALGLGLACAAGMALIGFILVPFAGLIGQSNRAVPTLAFTASFAMSADHWISLFGTASPLVATNWEYDIHLSVAVCLGGLAALAWWRHPAIRGALLVVLVSALIMAGEATPVFGLFYKFLPGFASFRVPARAGALVVLGLITAATLLAGARPPVARTRAALLLAGLFVASQVGRFYAQRLLGSPGAAGWLLGQLAWLAASVAAWWLWLGPADGAVIAGSRRRRWLLPAVVSTQFLLAVWCLKNLPGYQSEFPAEAVVKAAIHARGLDRAAAPVRVCLPPDSLRENSGMIWRYANLTGFESLSLKRVWTYLHLAVGADPHHAYNTTPDGRIYAAAGRLGAFNLGVTLPEGSGELRLDPAPDPRAYVVSRVTIVPDAETAVARMVAGQPFHEEALVEAPWASGLPPLPGPAGGTAEVRSFALNSLEIAADSPGPGVLVVAEAWYPGWRATIDGREVPCFPVNGWMRGVVVPAGSTRVRLHYEQQGLLLGAAVSLLAAALLIGLWRRAPTPPVAAA